MTIQTEGWWSRRWLAWLRALQVGPETESQVKSAGKVEGQVRLEKGRVTARIWVGHRRKVEALLKVKPWGDREWRRVLDAIAARPDLSQRVLSGTMGPELDQALTELELPLFPDQASVGCSCGNRSLRCRHFNYLALQTAQMLDGSPFLWLEVLGKGRQELLADLKGRLADREEAKSPTRDDPEGEVALTAPQAGEPLDPARFWETDLDPETISVRPGASTAPDGLIRALGPLPVEEPLFLLPAREPVTAHEYIRRMVVRVGRTATALALGEREPAYRIGPAVGKPVPLAARLAREVEEVVRAEGAMLLLDDLWQRCPTAMALGEEAVRKPLQEACSLLPPDLITVAGRYVGPGQSLLEGATFRHVVTLAEWQAGEGDEDADWVRALAAAGRPRVSLAPYFRQLRPEVGDELWLTLHEGGLAVSLKRRAERELEERLHADAVAARLLQVLTGLTRTGALPEREAVAALLAEGGYRGDLQPDPLWLLPLLGPGLYPDPAGRAVTRQPNSWRPGFPRFVYANWRRDQALMAYQARLMKEGLLRRPIEIASACITWWGRLWPGAQDQASALDSLGPFLHFLWNVAPREAARQRIPSEQVPAIMAGWFRFLEEAYPAARGAYAGHLLACSLLEHYAERCQTAPADDAGEGSVLAWQAEAYRWMGPALYLSTGSYR